MGEFFEKLLVVWVFFIIVSVVALIIGKAVVDTRALNACIRAGYDGGWAFEWPIFVSDVICTTEHHFPSADSITPIEIP